MTTRRTLAALLAIAMAVAPAAGATDKKRKAREKRAKAQVQVLLAEGETPADALLDVGLRVLDPGLPDETEQEALEAQGIYSEVRKSEARFIPFHLKDTLETTGHWGAVRILPAGSANTDLIVEGEILLSNGLTLMLAVIATDSTGRVWIDRKYKEQADLTAYNEDAVERRDPFQNLYNELANDLVEARAKLDETELHRIRDVTRLRFAADLAPVAFVDYLAANRKGRISLERLPAENDPMMVRLVRIRDRDYLFIDTLNERYAEFYTRMHGPYEEWRKFSYEEQKALTEMRREAMFRKIFGAVLMVAGVAVAPGSTAGRVATDGAIIAGGAVLKSGMDLTKEARMHREALRELAQSFESEISPLLVDIDGQTLRLEGSAEGQYAEWRRLLHEIFLNETGLPTDPNANGTLGDGGGSR